MIGTGIPLVLMLTTVSSGLPPLPDKPPAGTTVSGVSIPAPPPLLNIHHRRKPALLHRGRNPFQFADAPGSLMTAPHPARPPMAAVTAPMPEAPVRLTLIGVAGQRTPVGMDRMALIVDGQGALQIARVGERLDDDYQILAIGADFTDVKVLITGRAQRLRLR